MSIPSIRSPASRWNTAAIVAAPGSFFDTRRNRMASKRYCRASTVEIRDEVFPAPATADSLNVSTTCFHLVIVDLRKWNTDELRNPSMVDGNGCHPDRLHRRLLLQPT